MHEARTVLGGAGMALAMGLLLGGAMRPNLAGDDRPAGPQTILGKSAERSIAQPSSIPTSSGYAGVIPDYVTGTDLKKSVAWRDDPTPESLPAPRPDRRDALPPAVVFTRAGDDEPPVTARYPSLGGGLLPTHAPVGQAVDDVDEAPDAG
jgi:hypothetical protein